MVLVQVNETTSVPLQESEIVASASKLSLSDIVMLVSVSRIHPGDSIIKARSFDSKFLSPVRFQWYERGREASAPFHHHTLLGLLILRGRYAAACNGLSRGVAIHRPLYPLWIVEISKKENRPLFALFLRGLTLRKSAFRHFGANEMETKWAN
jgi:hypothetical protein